MNGLPTMGGASTANSLAAAPTINNPKQASISKATNGFVIQLQKTDSYGADMAVAKSIEEAVQVISEYLN